MSDFRQIESEADIEDARERELDVIHQQPLSRRIAHDFEVEHESPQVILLRRGRPVFDASHGGVSAHALERELRGFISRLPTDFPDSPD